MGEPLVVVTVGSGQDGAPVLGAMLAALRAWPERAGVGCLLVEGPLMPDADRLRVRSVAAGLPGVRVLPRVGHMMPVLARASVVVSMAGFNTVCEILACGRPAVLVPRAERTQEQRIRARILASRGLVEALDPEALTPALLLARVRALLAAPDRLRPAPRWPAPLRRGPDVAGGARLSGAEGRCA